MSRVTHMGATAAQRKPEESTDLGHSARTKLPRSAHGLWKPAADRRDPVAILVEQATSRVPELGPIRYSRMLASPFSFYRGAAAIMAHDLAHTPTTGLTVQICGDAHIANFGGFAAPDRRLVFDLNDFDETLPGPWEWDVKRLAASIEIAARDRAFKGALRRSMCIDAVRTYREAMRDFARQRYLDIWYARLDATDLVRRFGAALTPGSVKGVHKTVRKARGKDNLRALSKLTERVRGRLRFISAPPLIVPVEALASRADAARMTASMAEVLWNYRATLQEDRRHLFDRFRYVQLARKVVGVGSVGTRTWALLLEGRDGKDALILQAKEAGASVLERFAGASTHANHGQRVVEGQRLMQAASDIFLGWDRVVGVDGQTRDFYLRQLWDGKGSSNLEAISAERLAAYACVCAWTLARAHARSGDARAIATYLGRSQAFDTAIARFASAYAEQNALDHQALQDAAAAGRIATRSGV